jgi:hypothetical protein
MKGGSTSHARTAHWGLSGTGGIPTDVELWRYGNRSALPTPPQALRRLRAYLGGRPEIENFLIIPGLPPGGLTAVIILIAKYCLARVFPIYPSPAPSLHYFVQSTCR